MVRCLTVNSEDEAGFIAVLEDKDNVVIGMGVAEQIIKKKKDRQTKKVTKLERAYSYCIYIHHGNGVCNAKALPALLLLYRFILYRVTAAAGVCHSLSQLTGIHSGRVTSSLLG